MICEIKILLESNKQSTLVVIKPFPNNETSFSPPFPVKQTKFHLYGLCTKKSVSRATQIVRFDRPLQIQRDQNGRKGDEPGLYGTESEMDIATETIAAEREVNIKILARMALRSSSPDSKDTVRTDCNHLPGK